MALWMRSSSDFLRKDLQLSLASVEIIKVLKLSVKIIGNCLSQVLKKSLELELTGMCHNLYLI